MQTTIPTYRLKTDLSRKNAVIAIQLDYIAEMERNLDYAKSELNLMEDLSEEQHDAFAAFIQKGCLAQGIQPAVSEEDNLRVHHEMLVAFVHSQLSNYNSKGYTYVVIDVNVLGKPEVVIYPFNNEAFSVDMMHPNYTQIREAALNDAPIQEIDRLNACL